MNLARSSWILASWAAWFLSPLNESTFSLRIWSSSLRRLSTTESNCCCVVSLMGKPDWVVCLSKRSAMPLNSSISDFVSLDMSTDGLSVSGLILALAPSSKLFLFWAIASSTRLSSLAENSDLTGCLAAAVGAGVTGAGTGAGACLAAKASSGVALRKPKPSW